MTPRLRNKMGLRILRSGGNLQSVSRIQSRPEDVFMATQNATPADGQLILQLYDLRREAEMRKARKYCDNDFWPENFEEFQAVAMAWGTQESTWLHQVLAYWDMAASLVLRGALNAGLFFDNNHQMYFL